MNTTKLVDLARRIGEPLSKKVCQKEVENWSQAFWSSIERRRPLKDEGFTMMLPPPNITGNLHLGHALTVAIEDAIIRHRRMSGYDSMWIPGFDHAGLATQSIVERVIWAKHGLTRLQIGREKFMDVAEEWKELKRTEMRDQLRRLGLELDWGQEYFTMDEKSSLSVQGAFRRLFKKGLLYRGDRPVHWSKELGTTLSDIEVIKVDGSIRYIRTGEVVETRTLPQWYISAEDMSRRAVEVVSDATIKMIPPSYKNTWTSWLVSNGVKDWCVSRQSWWGHKIPAFKLKAAEDIGENWVVADSIEDASEILKCNIDDVMQDPDVLDTWFSSSLLALTISGWPNQQAFGDANSSSRFPLSIMETGFDILNFWVSKMVMMSLALENTIPFKLILLHGMICDSNGKKMSKSKGNIIDPLDIIDGASLPRLRERTIEFKSQGIMDENQMESALKNQEHLFPKGIPECGADGLRAYLLSHDFQEEIVSIQIQQIEKIRKLTNKIWNIYRFTLMVIDSVSGTTWEFDKELEKLDPEKFDAEDSIALKELAICVHIANESFHGKFDLHLPVNQIEQFWTTHLSTNFIAKARASLIDQRTSDAKVRKLELLVKLIVTATKLWHPFMPHLTEYLYQKLFYRVYGQEADHGSWIPSKLSETSYPKNEDWQSFLDYEHKADQETGVVPTTEHE